jgi:hypothetical protein
MSDTVCPMNESARGDRDKVTQLEELLPEWEEWLDRLLRTLLHTSLINWQADLLATEVEDELEHLMMTEVERAEADRELAEARDEASTALTALPPPDADPDLEAELSPLMAYDRLKLSVEREAPFCERTLRLIKAASLHVNAAYLHFAPRRSSLPDATWDRLIALLGFYERLTEEYSRLYPESLEGYRA